MFFEDVEDSCGCFLTLHKYFKKQAMLDPLRPRSTSIYLHDYRCLKARSDEDYVTDAQIDWPFLEEEEEEEEEDW
jgi:hypothetical protein